MLDKTSRKYLDRRVKQASKQTKDLMEEGGANWTREGGAGNRTQVTHVKAMARTEITTRHKEKQNLQNKTGSENKPETKNSKFNI